MAQPNPSNQPPTFRSNVNRAKTKKWIEAKSYSYDGDDWGDVDDYDEYGGYDDPPPPPPQAARATGLRQRGQSASQPADQYRGPSFQQSPYGDLGPSQSQQPYGRRSFTQPSQPPYIHRQNSFEPEEEQRAFPSGQPQPSTQRSATGPYPASTSQNQTAVQDFQSDQSHLKRLGPTYQSSPPSNLPTQRSIDDEARYPDQIANPQGSQDTFSSPQLPGHSTVDTRSHSTESNNSSLDFHNRRDFSPSAMPPPLQTKGPPSPNRGASRPPRTSSLGQDNAPQLPFPTQTTTNMPSAEAANAQRPPRDRASSSQSNKSLSIVRPADIYRRMEEEKERERRSQESSRPSMEAILPRPQLENNRDNVSGGRPRQMSSLDPVHERRQSEFALEGLGSNRKDSDVPEAQKQPEGKMATTSKRFEVKKPSNTQSLTGTPSFGPMLPDVTRLSGFGDSFGDSVMGAAGGIGGFSSPADPEVTSAQGSREPELHSRSTTLAQAQENPGTDLQHQPSLGFTSAVHQSFDNAEDQVPATPSSNTDSSIQRSASGGTSAVSPIISRGPSTATEPWNNSLPTIHDITTPTHQATVQPASQRPISIVGKPSASQSAMEQPLESSPPPSFIPGHRRNMSTPSPDNSPAKTPLVEANRQLRSPQEVELAEATPTPTESDYSADEHGKATSQPIDQYPTPDQLALSEGRGRTAPDQAKVLAESAKAASPTTPTSSFAHEHTNSTDSGKVRSLAEKFGGNGGRPQSSRSNTTPRASIPGPNVPETDDLVPPRPITERMESFRPHLPGGWESSASIAPATYGGQAPSGQKHEASRGSAPNQEGEAPSTIANMKDASHDAFAAAATAGSALAASLAAAAGVGSREGEGQESEEEWKRDSDRIAEQARDRGTSINTIVRSEASTSPLDPRVDKATSVVPTPLPKDTPMYIEKESASSDYFTDSSLAKPLAIGEGSQDGSRRNSHQLPPLTTDLQLQRPQYESDRLRREIVKELAPNTVSEPSTAESPSPYPTSSKYSMDQSAGAMTVPENGGLSREHDNFGNDKESMGNRMNIGSADSREVQDMKAMQPHQDAATSETAVAMGGAAVVGSFGHPGVPQNQAPLEAVETSQMPQKAPPILPHRFSWEVPLQDLGPQQEPVPASYPPPAVSQAVNQAPQAPSSDFLRSDVQPDRHSLGERDAESRDTLKRHSDQSSTVAETSTLGLNNSLRSREGNREAAVDSHDTDVVINEADNLVIEEARHDKGLPSYPGNGPEAAEYTSEKETLNTSSVRVGPDDRGYSPSGLQDQSPLSATEKSTPITPKPTDAPLPSAPLPPAPLGSQPNIPSFRALLALKTPTERIRAYNGTREQFANLNTGLGNWLAVTANDLPEHSDLLSNHGRVTTTISGHKPSSSRSGLPSGPSSSAPTYAPGFSPSGGGAKISSKEVQAKSKEFLHTAGVFGGKGIVAGKGLFSKGKSKLRGASGTDKAPQVAVPPSSPGPVFRGMQASEGPRTHSQEQITSHNQSVSHNQTVEPHFHPSENTQSGSNTPSEQSVSKGRLGDDERSSDEYESTQSGPDEAGPPPPRSSSLFIGDKHGSNGRVQPLPKSTTSSGDTARTIMHETAKARSTRGTQSPRSTHSSNKTPTQSSFDHAKAMPSMPYALERTESPQEAHSELTTQPISNPSTDMQSSSLILARSRRSDDNSKGGAAQVVDSARNRTLEDLNAMDANGVYEGTQSHDRRPETRTGYLMLPTPEFSPLMDEDYTTMSVLPDISRDPHSRGLSIGSIPSALDPDHPPSPISPFVPPGEDPHEQRRGRSIVPVHHGIAHDFIEESSVERARRRSPSFSRPFQTGRTPEDSRPFAERNSKEHQIFRPSSDSSDVELPVKYRPSHSSDKEPSNLRERAPEYHGFGQEVPDMPSAETTSQSRRGSRSSAYLKKIRDTVSPSRRSRREISRPSLPDSSRASDSPQSVARVSQQSDPQEKPRRSSVFGRTKTNASSRTDQAPNRGDSAPRAATMPVQQPSQTNVGIERPKENNNPVSNKMGTASRLAQKLQRASTTTDQPKLELGGSKKKRFSGMGSLFGRHQRRQNSDQFGAMPPQQYGQHNGHAPRHTQRFPLDDDLHGDPSLALRPSAAHNMDPSPPQVKPATQPQTQPYGDLPAYVQDRMLRQPSGSYSSPGAKNTAVKPSADISNPNTNHITVPPHQPTNVPNKGSPVALRPAPAARSISSWSKFSQTGRSNSSSRHTQPTAPPPQPLVSLSHIKDFVSSPPLGYGSRPTQRSWIEGTDRPPRTFGHPPKSALTKNQRPIRSESPPPPPPPPKDSRWAKSSNSKFHSNHTRSGSTPLQRRSSPATEQRQSLQPLQTSIPGSRVSARSSAAAAPLEEIPPSVSRVGKESMTAEENRKSRQEEFEKGHLSPNDGAASDQKEKMSVLQEDEAVNEKETVKADSRPPLEDDESIVMSATSFPGQMWQPDFLAWEGE